MSNGGPPSAPLDVPPLFQGAPKVSSLPGLPETSPSNFPKALLALSLPERYEGSLEGVPHYHEASQYAVGNRNEVTHRGEHAARREWHMLGPRGAGSFRRARPQAVALEIEDVDPARSICPIVHGAL